MEDTSGVAAPSRGTVYGRVIRERGTTRLLLLAVALAVAWYLYGLWDTNRLLQAHWPPLQPSKTGLIVLGLQDQGMAGKKARFVAIESNHSWHICYRDDDTGSSDEGPETPESKDRG